MHNINIHLIQDQALSSQYNTKSRYNTLPSFIQMFYKEGYATAEVWLENNYQQLGSKSSIDLAALFC